jgi:ketosteroid isomerase-like protein
MTAEDRIAALEQRLRRVEDELAIGRLMASYGPLVDAGDADAVAGLWAEDGEYDVEGWHMRSRAGANHVMLRRTAAGWRIVKRISRQLDGSAEARDLLAAGVMGRRA